MEHLPASYFASLSDFLVLTVTRGARVDSEVPIYELR